MDSSELPSRIAERACNHPSATGAKQIGTAATDSLGPDSGLGAQQAWQCDRTQQGEGGHRKRVADEQVKRILRRALEEECHAGPGASGPADRGRALHGSGRNRTTEGDTEASEHER